MKKLAPRLTMDELFLEIKLTNRKHIIVEGPSDKRFITSWLLSINLEQGATVTSVDRIHVETCEVVEFGLTDSNRGRVVTVGAHAATSGVDLRAVADRDCGDDVLHHDHETLLWTDYPALESYCLDLETLDRANLMAFGEQLPPGGVLMPALSFALGELYSVRMNNPNLAKPNYTAGVNQKGTLSDFDVSKSVHPSIRPNISKYKRPDDTEPKNFAYGHDIGELLFAQYKNKLKNTLGLGNASIVEKCLMSAVQIVGSFKEEKLFVTLEEWISNGIS